MHEPAPSCFCLDRWRVDPAGSRLDRDGETVRLEPRVMDLLVYLAEHRGRTVSREELERNVWQGTVVSYDAYTKAIIKLRRALNDDSRHPRIIETLSKRGYRLIAPVTPAEDAVAAPPARSRTEWYGRFTRRGRIGGVVVFLIAVLIGAIVSFRPWYRVEPTAEPMPERPAIAVLPFDSLSDNSDQGYLADGITDDLTTELAKQAGLFVIARDSSFIYKNRPDHVSAIALALHARYLLRGSVQRVGGRLRINAQLIDATTGGHLWAERYEGDVRQLFALQKEIIIAVLGALTPGAPPTDQPERVLTRSPEAYEYFLRGRQRFFLYASKDDNQKARSMFQKAIELDPNFALAYAMVGRTHVFDAMNGWSDVREQSLMQAQSFAERAIALDTALPVAYFVTGLVYRERREYMKALAEVEKAIQLDPNYANAHVLLATLLYYTGRPRESLARLEQALRLNPHFPFNYQFHIGQAHFVLQEYDAAIAAFERGLESNPSEERLRVWLAAAYAQAGLIEDARWEADQVRTTNPGFSSTRILQAFPFQDARDLEQFAEGLRMAGLDSDVPASDPSTEVLGDN